MKHTEQEKKLELNRSDLKPEAREKKLAMLAPEDLDVHVTKDLINASRVILVYDESEGHQGHLVVLKDPSTRFQTLP